MPNQVAKVRRADLVACMICPLCDRLLRQATTISLCLHTFCRKCIYEKLSDDDYDTCPVCDINLGCNPVDKLRPDHNLQDIGAKIFRLKRKKVEADEAATSVSPPTKRKERSLSSLVVSMPKESVHAGAIGRRTRASQKKSSSTRGSTSSSEEDPPSKEEDSEEDYRSSSPENLNKIVQNKKLASSSAKSSNDPIVNEDVGKSSADEKVDLWKPLKCLVEAANRTKFPKSNLAEPSDVKADPFSAHDADTHTLTTGLKENGHRAEAQDDPSSVPSPAKRKRLRPSNRNAAVMSGDSSNSPALLVDGMRLHRQNMPIWFSLVASEDQDGAASLPQLSYGFLRIKNGDMPVSSIQKYIAKKLELASEDEVQIMLQGQAVLPSLHIRKLLDTWLKSAPVSRRIQTSVGSSGKEFVMVLTYSRKAQAQAQAQAQAHDKAHEPPENENNSS